MNTFIHFDNETDANTYRSNHGTGGHIFVITKCTPLNEVGQAWLFPPEMTCSEIMTHPITAGKDGAIY